MPTTLERIPVRHLGANTYPAYSQSVTRQWDAEESSYGTPIIVPPAPPRNTGKPAPALAPEQKLAEIKKK